MVFVADDFGAWLVGAFADAGRRRLTALILGGDQERALRSAATAAVQRTASELRPGGDEQAAELAMVINEVFGAPVPTLPLAGNTTLLEALQSAIAAQLTVLDDTDLTGTGQSSADLLGVSGALVTAKLTGHLLREIVMRGSGGGPLFPLTSQMNHDVTHLQGQRLENMMTQFTREVRDARVRVGASYAAGVPPLGRRATQRAHTRASMLLPNVISGRREELDELYKFACGHGDKSVYYRWIEGEPWSGKTTLAAQIAVQPPKDVDVVSFFIIDRLRSQWDSSAYLQDICSQLAELAVSSPAATPLGHFTAEDLADLTVAACEIAHLRGRRLLFLIDGLDEDQSSRAMTGLPSIASLLPSMKSDIERAVLRIIVTSRPYPPIPSDVDGEHPVNSAAKTLLAPFSGASDRLNRARIEIQSRLVGDSLGADVISLLAAAAPNQQINEDDNRTRKSRKPGKFKTHAAVAALEHIDDQLGSVGLTLDEIAALTGCRSAVVSQILSSGFGSCLACSHQLSAQGSEGPIYYFAHQTLTAVAQQEVGKRDLAAARERLYSWVANVSARGWSEPKSDFLLFGYPRLLLSLADATRLYNLVMDGQRQALLYAETQSDRQTLLELHSLQRLEAQRPSPAIETIIRLAIRNHELSSGNSLITSELCRSWARIEGLESAYDMAVTIPDAEKRDNALKDLISEALRQGLISAARQILTSMSHGYIRCEAATAVAKEFARRGQVEEAKTLLQYMNSDLSRIQAFIDIAEATIECSMSLLPVAKSLIDEALDCSRNSSNSFDRVEGFRRVVANVSVSLKPEGVAGEFVELLEGSASEDRLVDDAIEASVREGDQVLAMAIVNRSANEDQRTKALCYFASALVMVGELDQARDVLDQIVGRSSHDLYRPILELIRAKEWSTAFPLIPKVSGYMRGYVCEKVVSSGGDWKVALQLTTDPFDKFEVSIAIVKEASIDEEARTQLLRDARKLLVRDFYKSHHRWVRMLLNRYQELEELGFPARSILAKILQPSRTAKIDKRDLCQLLVIARRYDDALAQTPLPASNQVFESERIREDNEYIRTWTMEGICKDYIESGNIETGIALSATMEPNDATAYSLARLAKLLAGIGCHNEAVTMSSAIGNPSVRRASQCDIAYAIANMDLEFAKRIMVFTMADARSVGTERVRSEIRSHLMRGLIAISADDEDILGAGRDFDVPGELRELLRARDALPRALRSRYLLSLLPQEDGVERMVLTLARRGAEEEAVSVARSVEDVYRSQKLLKEIGVAFASAGRLEAATKVIEMLGESWDASMCRVAVAVAIGQAGRVREALSVARQLQAGFDSLALARLAGLEAARGNISLFLEIFRESVQRSTRVENVYLALRCWIGLFLELELVGDQAEEARQLIERYRPDVRDNSLDYEMPLERFRRFFDDRDWNAAYTAAVRIGGPGRGDCLLRMLDYAPELDSSTLRAVIADIVEVAARNPSVGSFDMPGYRPDFGDWLIARAVIRLSAAGFYADAIEMVNSITSSHRWFAEAVNACASAMSFNDSAEAASLITSALMSSRYDLALPAAALVHPLNYRMIVTELVNSS